MSLLSDRLSDALSSGSEESLEALMRHLVAQGHACAWRHTLSGIFVDDRLVGYFYDLGDDAQDLMSEVRKVTRSEEVFCEKLVLCDHTHESPYRLEDWYTLAIASQMLSLKKSNLNWKGGIRAVFGLRLFQEYGHRMLEDLKRLECHKGEYNGLYYNGWWELHIDENLWCRQSRPFFSATEVHDEKQWLTSVFEDALEGRL